METDCISYEDIDFLPKLMSHYLTNSSSVTSFYNQPPTSKGFENVIKNRRFSTEKRLVLAKALENQYHGIPSSKGQLDSIELLKQENTYTVTTGHQLVLATGPLYFVYKILSVVKLAKQLQLQFEDKNFVPVYWMATEDHDFLEINHFFTSKNNYEWPGQNDIPVGMKKPEVQAQIDQLEKELEPSEWSKKWISILRNAYIQKSLTKATRLMVHELLGKYGVLIIDGDDKLLKAEFAPFMKQELLRQTAEKEVNATINNLQQNEYSAQVTPRDINLFYLHENGRFRITKTASGFALVDNAKSWNETEILKELETYPERFSPNVLMRPLYQETILPNLSYSGGAGEMSYWFELKSMFEKFDVDFPILLMRNSAILVSKRDKERLAKLKLNWSQLFLNTANLEKLLVEIHGSGTTNLNEYRAKLKAMFHELAQLSGSIDKTLEPSAGVSEAQALKAIDRLEKKLIRGEKLNLETVMEMKNRIQSTLFPSGNFQERKLNVSEFYAMLGDDLLDELLDAFEPLQPDITIIRY